MRLGVEAAIVEGQLLRGDIEVADGRIVSVGLAPKRGGGIAAPGFVDLQVNGYAGVDFAAADAAGYKTAGEALLEGGVTAYQPTLITAPEDALIAALQEVPVGEQAGPRVLGAHLEGPFLSPRPPRSASRGGAARSRPRAPRTAARRRAGVPHDARARAARSARARRPPPGTRRSSSPAGTPTRPQPRRTRPSTAASARSLTSSTRCGRSATATLASSAPRSSATT